MECEKGGYPLIYEREGDGKRIVVIISPRSERITREIPHKSCLISSNTEITGDKITLFDTGFAILEI